MVKLSALASELGNEKFGLLFFVGLFLGLWQRYTYDRNVSTTPLRQWGFWQCLPFSWTTLGGKHCRHPIAIMGVVDYGNGVPAT